MLQSFNPKDMLFWRVWNIAFRRSLATEQYQSDNSLLCWPLNRIPFLPGLYYSSLQELALSNRVRLEWVPGHCDIHGNVEDDALARAGSAFVGLEPCLPLAPLIVRRREWKWLLTSNCASCWLSSVENVAKKA
jgi:hypothetical protein